MGKNRVIHVFGASGPLRMDSQDHTATNAPAAGDSIRSHHRSSLIADWPTVDGSLGLSEQDSIGYARRFFKFGFVLLPWLWAVNCFYFWPVLRSPSSYFHPDLRRYVVGSAIGFAVFTAVLCSWAITFAVGGENLFGNSWNELVMYNVADKYGLTGWM